MLGLELEKGARFRVRSTVRVRVRKKAGRSWLEPELNVGFGGA